MKNSNSNLNVQNQKTIYTKNSQKFFNSKESINNEIWTST